jgi:hypothetical protein
MIAKKVPFAEKDAVKRFEYILSNKREKLPDIYSK